MYVYIYTYSLQSNAELQESGAAFVAMLSLYDKLDVLGFHRDISSVDFIIVPFHFAVDIQQLGTTLMSNHVTLFIILLRRCSCWFCDCLNTVVANNSQRTVIFISHINR